jgi:threonine synthase
VSSNFERLLFDLFDRDGAALAERMTAFRRTGSLDIERERWQRALALFTGARFSDEETLAVIREIHDTLGMLVDPHTAVGIAAGRARRRDPNTPLVALATAHPAKFPDAVERATGVRPLLPPHMADLFEREEHCVTLPNDVAAIRDYVCRNAGRARA